MKSYGKIVTCDKCGASIFLKRVAFGSVDEKADGDGHAYQSLNVYQNLPDSWGEGFGMDLCPECMKDYERTERIFKDRCNRSNSGVFMFAEEACKGSE
jgi:hypothetical protein